MYAQRVLRASTPLHPSRVRVQGQCTTSGAVQQRAQSSHPCGCIACHGAAAHGRRATVAPSGELRRARGAPSYRRGARVRAARHPPRWHGEHRRDGRASRTLARARSTGPHATWRGGRRERIAHERTPAECARHANPRGAACPDPHEAQALCSRSLHDARAHPQSWRAVETQPAPLATRHAHAQAPIAPCVRHAATLCYRARPCQARCARRGALPTPRCARAQTARVSLRRATTVHPATRLPAPLGSWRAGFPRRDSRRG